MDSRLAVSSPAAARRPASHPWRLAFLIPLLAASLTACMQINRNPGLAPAGPVIAAPPRPVEPQSVKVAVVVPLSGQAGDTGRALRDAAELALFDLNATDVEMLPRDAGNSGATASGAVQNAVDAGANIVIGPLGAGPVRAAGLAARAAGLKLLGFSTDRAAGGAGIYLMGFTPEEQIEAIIDYGARNGLHRFAALLPVGSYGDLVDRAFQSAVTGAGGAVAGTLRYGRGGTVSADELRGLVAPGPDGRPPIDALLVPEGGATLRQIGTVLANAGFQPSAIRLLGTDQWTGSALGRDPMTIGGWFAGPEPGRFDRFAARFQDTYGTRPPRIAAQAYDAMTLAVALARQPNGFLNAERTLGSPDGFLGVDGLFRFDRNGVPQHGLAILEVQAGGAVVIQPSPAGFGGPAF